MKDASHFILATAGHVDHGKSSLVKALTGTDPDRLPEEKARGITIDLGFARLTLPRAGADSPVFEVGIVDVPGHEDFVKNMVAGVGSIDVALLVVAADDGWMPQTEEHLQILSYLGVARGVVALTKIDLAERGEEQVAHEIRERLQGSPFAAAPIIRTSIIDGRGLEELKRALTDTLATAPPPRDIGKPRLSVDRVFTLRGIGTVVTGTLTGGRFQRGQAVVLQPSKLATRLRTIQSHNQEIPEALPGTRTALSLTDVAVAAKGASLESAEGVRRGQVVTLAEFGSGSDAMEVLLQRSPRPQSGTPERTRDLRDGTVVRVHLGTASLEARILLLNQKQIAPGEQAFAQLRFETPVFGFAGDSLIVRDSSERATLAGGIILNPEATRRGFRNAAHYHFLRRLYDSLQDPAGAIESWLEQSQMARRNLLLQKSNFSTAEIAAASERLQSTGKLVALGELLAEPKWWAAQRAEAMEAVDAQHRAHPEEVGLPIPQLRARFKTKLPVEVFGTLVADLLKSGYVQSGIAIKRASHQAALPAPLQAAGAQLRSALSVKPLDPPSKKEFASTPVSQQALRFLLQTGEAVEISAELVLLSENYKKAVALITQRLRSGPPATVSELKQVLGASRRVVVPLLEKLDRDGITRRQGDVRTLRAP